MSNGLTPEEWLDEMTCQPCTCKPEHQPDIRSEGFHIPDCHADYCAWRRQEERIAARRARSKA